MFTRASQYPDGFNPSHFTALGGFAGIRAAAKHALGRDDLEGLRVAVQGLGNTGSDLAGQLAEAGAVLTVADVTRKPSRTRSSTTAPPPSTRRSSTPRTWTSSRHAPSAGS